MVHPTFFTHKAMKLSSGRKTKRRDHGAQHPKTNGTTPPRRTPGVARLMHPTLRGELIVAWMVLLGKQAQREYKPSLF